MCILLTTSAHQEYPFMLLSNRDEYFKRPTATVLFHTVDTLTPTSNSSKPVLSPLDLAKPSHGTWIGITKTGRIGILVNYREGKEGEVSCAGGTNNSKVSFKNDKGATTTSNKVINGNNEIEIHDDSESNKMFSRGAIVNDFLASDLDADEWQAEFFKRYDKEMMKNIGGFSFLFGALDFEKIQNTTSSSNNTDSETDTENSTSGPKRIRPLKIISNRGATSDIFLPISTVVNTNNSTNQTLKKVTVDNSSGKKQQTTKENANDENAEKASKGIQCRENKSYIGLSNSLFLEPWPKVLIGENLLNNLVINSINESWNENKLIKEAFKLLSFNCITPHHANKHQLKLQDNKGFTPNNALSCFPNDTSTDDDLPEMDEVFDEMKSSIFIPPLKTKYYHDDNFKENPFVGDYYGTRTQTVILLRKDGVLKYIERTLHTIDKVIEPNHAFDITHTFNIFKEREIEKVRQHGSGGYSVESGGINGKRDSTGLQSLEVPGNLNGDEEFVADEDESNYADDENSIYSNSGANPGASVQSSIIGAGGR